MPARALFFLAIALSTSSVEAIAAPGQDTPLTAMDIVEILSQPEPEYSEEELVYTFDDTDNDESWGSDAGEGAFADVMDRSEIPARDFSYDTEEALLGDWNGDGLTDMVAYKVDAGDYMASLMIYEGQADGTADLVVDLPKAFPARGEGFGLLARSDTAFSVIQGAVMGASAAWRGNLVIAYRDGRYVVAGFEDSDFEFVDGEKVETRCDANLRTGRVERLIWFNSEYYFVDGWTPVSLDMPLSDYTFFRERKREICSAYIEYPD